jgi:hypothetical protein
MNLTDGSGRAVESIAVSPLRMDTLSESPFPSPCERVILAVRTDVNHRARRRATLINLRPSMLAGPATLLPVLCVFLFFFFFAFEGGRCF